MLYYICYIIYVTYCKCYNPNKSKCEVTSIGVLKRVKVAHCGMRCVNLHDDTSKILGILYSYNNQLENDENFKKWIAKVENVLKP